MLKKCMQSLCANKVKKVALSIKENFYVENFFYDFLVNIIYRKVQKVQKYKKKVHLPEMRKL